MGLSGDVICNLIVDSTLAFVSSFISLPLYCKTNNDGLIMF